MVSSRAIPSSLSYAEVNHVKFSHVHQIAKNAIAKCPTPEAACPSLIAWCRPVAA